MYTIRCLVVSKIKKAGGIHIQLNQPHIVVMILNAVTFQHFFNLNLISECPAVQIVELFFKTQQPK